MAEITSQAYTDLRNHMQLNWKYIELQNETGTKIVRLSPSDNRVTSTIEGNDIVITIIVKGSDTDITIPSTFTKSVIYNVANGGSPFSEETFEAPSIVATVDDQLTCIHTIQVPVIA